jgi:hypothetical protein
MKITKRQRMAIIKMAIDYIRSDGNHYLCNALSRAIQNTFHVSTRYSPEKIREYIPRFKQETAIKHFHAMGSFAWWFTDTEGKKLRLRFLRYLLTGKLPKVRK